MASVWGMASSAWIVCLAVTAESACGTNDATDTTHGPVQVHGVIASSTVAVGTACTFDSDPAQPSIASGTLDIALRHDYFAEYLVEFGALPEGGTDSVIALAVRITKENGASVASFLDAPAAAAFAPAGGPVYVPVGGTIINAQTVENDPDIQRIAALPLGSSTRVRLLTYARFAYETSGARGSTDEFPFPVDVCNGCLIHFTDAPTSPSPNCVVSTSAPPMPTTVPCQFGQDTPVDCRLCQSSPACAGMSSADADGGQP